MSAPLAFLDVNGYEVANSYRTASYVQNGLTTLALQAGGLGCEVLSREVGGVAPFVSPTADAAPWYDSTVAESADFLGLLITHIDFKTTKTTRDVNQRFGRGGTIGFAQRAARVIPIQGQLIAASAAGLEYGRAWLGAMLGEGAPESCALLTLRVRDSCPPTDGTNDTRGEFIVYDAALVDGIKRTDSVGDVDCYMDGVSFSLASESPYLFKRPTTAPAQVEIANIAGLVASVPASSVAIQSPIVTIVGTAATSTVRIQKAQYPPLSSEVDDFGSNSIPTKWYQTSTLYAISGGKLKPQATGARLIRRSADGTLAGILLWQGGRVAATVKLGSTITNGVWAVGLDTLMFAGLRKATNLFVLSSTATAGTTYDSEAFTPVAGHTYMIVMEALPNIAGTGWDVRAWVTDTAAPTVMLTPPLVATVTGTTPTTPCIYSTCVDTTEEWDTFRAQRRTNVADGAYVDVVIPPGTWVGDLGRRVAAFTPSGAAASVDGVQYMQSPTGFPIHWAEFAPLGGAGAVLVTATASATPGTKATVATQARHRT